MGKDMPANDLKARWKIESEHHDRSYKGGEISEFDPGLFYKTRPYGMRVLLDRLGNCKGRKVLDVGSGLGLFSRYLASLEAVVYALDLSLEALRGIDPKLGIRRIYGVAERLSFKSESFDIIWGAAVLHHLDIPAAAQDFCRVLKPGGRVFFFEPLGYNPIVNLYRKLTPSRRTPTEKPISLTDLTPLQEAFHKVDLQFFHLFAMIPQGLGIALGWLHLPGKKFYRKILWLEERLAKLDTVLFRTFPGFQKWAQVVVICCERD
jgi:SAM-dependent methyltransferase